MPNLWKNSLRRLADLFIQQTDRFQVSTLVVHAKDTPEGRKFLDGPAADHRLRGNTGIGNQVLPPSKVRIHAEDYPLRAIYFGGERDGARRFSDLITNIGDLLDQRPIQDLIPREYAIHYDDHDPQAIAGPIHHTLGAIQWVLLVHHLGLRKDEAAAFTLDRFAWTEDDWVNLDEAEFYESPDGFFSYCRNTFEGSAAAIDMLLDLPGRDTWITVPDAAMAMGKHASHVGRLVADGKIRSRPADLKKPEGRRKVSPKSVIQYLMQANRATTRKTDIDDDDADEGIATIPGQPEPHLGVQTRMKARFCPLCGEGPPIAQNDQPLAYRCFRCKVIFVVNKVG